MAEVKLDKSIFAVEVKNRELLKLAYESHLANNRQVGAVTLRRGEVRGGGKKPWRQKGTGRARFGSSRNPIWRGGGVVFGPLGVENYTKKISKTAKKVALRQALSLLNQEKKILVLDKIVAKNGKTREIAKLLIDNKISEKDRVLIATAEKTDELLRATANIPNLKLVSANFLNVFDLLNADRLILENEAVAKINDWLQPEKTNAKETK